MKTITMISLVIVTVFLLSSCAVETPTTRQPIPAEYAGKKNPLAGNADAVAKGKELFQYNEETKKAGYCDTCHGKKGDGDGSTAVALMPKPLSLIKAAKETSDAYLFWRTSNGGGYSPFYSAMPSFKGVLTEDQIWQIITYIQSLK